MLLKTSSLAWHLRHRLTLLSIATYSPLRASDFTLAAHQVDRLPPRRAPVAWAKKPSRAIFVSEWILSTHDLRAPGTDAIAEADRCMVGTQSPEQAWVAMTGCR